MTDDDASSLVAGLARGRQNLEKSILREMSRQRQISRWAERGLWLCAAGMLLLAIAIVTAPL